MRKAFFLPAAIGASASLAAIFLTGVIANSQDCEKDADCRLGDVCRGTLARDLITTVRVCMTDVEADMDRDGVPDNVDNCQKIENPGQDDFDRDGKGDRCDEDDDNDWVMDEVDNCPQFYNPDQYPANKQLRGLVRCSRYSSGPKKQPRDLPLQQKLPRDLPQQQKRPSNLP